MNDLNDTVLFFRKFLRHELHIASAVPSSRYLARAAMHGIDWNHARVILELGAGTGPLTAAIVARARPECKIIAIERDEDFIHVLRRRFSHHHNVEIVHGSVADIEDILSKRGITKVDNVVSGLPLPSFPREMQTQLFRDLRKVLSPEGTFNQITEVPLLFRSFYRIFFKDVKFVFEPRNIPPGGVYICRSFRQTQ